MFFKKLCDKYLRKHKIVEYFRKKGVCIGKNTSVACSVKFDTEPYLVSIGDNVFIGNNASIMLGVKMIRKNIIQMYLISKYNLLREN